MTFGGLCLLQNDVYQPLSDERHYLWKATELAFRNPKGDWATRRTFDRAWWAVKNLIPLSVCPSGCPPWDTLPVAVRQQAALRWYRWALRVCQHADRIMQEAQ